MTPPSDESGAVIDAAYLAHQREWSEATFGPGDRLQGVLDHIRKELAEVESNPCDVTEWADLIILAFDGAWRAGHEPQAILDAVAAKQARNERRQWPDWRTQPADKAIEHVRLCQVMCETRRFGPMPCGTPLPCDIHPEGVTEDNGRLASAIHHAVCDATSASGRQESAD